jgi:murein DD-endopeptidase MepM/ murein hydrolase activator NlpD
MEESIIKHLHAFPPKVSPFTTYFIQANGLEKKSFKKWVFRPGMQFGSRDKWWGDLGNRGSEHEGLDFYLYKDGEDNLNQLTEMTRVPAMYSGKVVGFINDFLGESVILKHEFHENRSHHFCTLYAHTRRFPGLGVGEKIKKGDVIATVADTRRSKAGVPPHLHISAAWMIHGISYEKLDWATMGRRSDVLLIDPLTLIIP